MQTQRLDSIPQDQAIDCEVCIVGSGPAGATLARELAASNLRVIVLESGGLAPDPAADALNEIENIGAARTLDQSIVRNRILGGTSHTWTGRCAALDEIDYRRRPWVAHSGWPIGPEEMVPYLDRSAAHLGLGAGSGFTGPDFWQLTKRKRPAPAIDEHELLPFFWQFSRTAQPLEPMRFGPCLAREPAPGGRIITHATAVHVNTNAEASRVVSVEAAAPDDRRWTVQTRAVALCGGGVENARLLLASNRVAAAGLGNGRDLVGRFLMDHPRGGVAVFDAAKADELAPHFGFHTVRSGNGTHLFCQGLRLSPAMQEREGLLSCAVWLSELVDENDPWSAIKRIASRRADWRRDPLRVLRHSGLVARGAYQSLVKGGGVARRLAGLELNCIVEQAPDPQSRVTLSDRKDRHGMPLSRLDWRIGEQEQQTVRRTAHLVAEALAQQGIAAPVLEAWVSQGKGFPRSFADVSHHIGTTRMALDAGSGVVDAQCAVHGVTGLYIAGSSVFPTGGHANPTQMIVALSIRLADWLKRPGMLPSSP